MTGHSRVQGTQSRTAEFSGKTDGRTKTKTLQFSIRQAPIARREAVTSIDELPQVQPDGSDSHRLSNLWLLHGPRRR